MYLAERVITYCGNALQETAQRVVKCLQRVVRCLQRVVDIWKRPLFEFCTGKQGPDWLIPQRVVEKSQRVVEIRYDPYCL